MRLSGDLSGNSANQTCEKCQITRAAATVLFVLSAVGESDILWWDMFIVVREWGCTCLCWVVGVAGEQPVVRTLNETVVGESGTDGLINSKNVAVLVVRPRIFFGGCGIAKNCAYTTLGYHSVGA